jgi:hypothetical protein
LATTNEGTNPMRPYPRLVSIFSAGALLLAAGGLGAGTASATPSAASGVGVFNGSSAEISNPYLPITKFHRTVLKGVDTGQHLRIVRTLQKRTKAFKYQHKTVKSAVVKDVVTNVKAHRVIEKTVDYFAQDAAGTVYYFGEDVNEYKPNGHISHEGQWRLGRDTHTPGILMPAHPKLGDSYKAEAVPGVTTETDHIVAVGLKKRIAGHTYHHVIKVRENAGPPPEVEFKKYAPGTGVITEANGGVHLVRSR